jgi:hypothetical protein
MTARTTLRSMPVTAAKVLVDVAAGASTGSITVTTPAGTAISATPFKVVA